MRCPEPCGKIRFDSDWMAKLSAILIAMEKGIVLTPYHSDKCGTYHLSGHNHGKLRKGKAARKMRKYVLAPEMGRDDPGPGDTR